MATSLGIANAALAILGSAGINDFDQEVPHARAVKALYDITREEVLRSHPWRCATKYASIAVDGADPDTTDWAYSYTLPSDFLKLLHVGEYGFEPDHRIVGRKIYTDEASPLQLKYIFLNDDENTWDSLLTSAMVYTLAERLSYAVTGSTPLSQFLNQKMREVMREARSVDGQDEPPETVGDFPLRQVR